MSETTPARFYRLTLQGKNPRMIPPIEVNGELRQGVRLRTPSKPGRVRHQLVDADWFDALQEQGAHIWEDFAAPSIRTVEGPIEDGAEGLYFNGDPIPHELHDSESVYRTNSIPILRALLPQSTGQANLIRRCMRLLSGGGSPELRRYVWGRNLVTNASKLEDPSDQGYLRSEVWLSYPDHAARELPKGPRFVQAGSGL